MKVLSVISLSIGAIVTLIGILPIIFYYPFSNSPNSGPANLWELILMISYEGKGWYLIVGITLLLLSFFLIFRQRKLQFWLLFQRPLCLGFSFALFNISIVV